MVTKPGTYVVVGGQATELKNLSLLDPSAWGLEAGETNPSLAALARDVEWVFIALEKRRNQIAQTPFQWLENGREIEPPFMLDSDMFERVDIALQTYSKAYLHKRRLRGRKFDALGWMDPTTIQPVTETRPNIYEGYTQYRRMMNENDTVDNAPLIPSGDLVRIERLGMSELMPGSSAGEATKAAAQIIRAINKTADGIYDNNNGLPIMLIQVPQGTADKERTRLANRFRALFNSNSKYFGQRQKTVGVPEGVNAVPLSISPEKLVMSEESEGRITAILAAHGVPKSMVMGDTANYATAQAERQNFALTIGHRVRWIASKFNADPDMQALGLSCDVNVQEMAVTLEDQERRVNMWSMFVDRNVDPMGAFKLVGIEPPENLTIEIQEPVAEPPPDEDSAVDTEIRKLKKFIKRNGHLKRPFESDVFTEEEIKFYTELETGNASDSPFYP